MKKNRGYMYLFFAALLSVIAYSVYGILEQGQSEVYYSVSVILDDSSNERWNALKEGLNQGAREMGIHLNVVSTGRFQNFTEECTIIQRELEQGADGVIVEPCGMEQSEFASPAGDHPMVLVETDVSPDELHSVVMPDPQKVGQALAEAAAGEKGQRIGVLSGNQHQTAMRLRLAGFEEALKETGGQIAWSVSREELEAMEDGEEFLRQNPVEVLVALENDETEWAVDFLLGNEAGECRLYGVGRSGKAVYYLDKGIIQELVVPNEYYMGYQSVVILAEQMNYHTTAAKRDEVDFLRVTQENLYDEEIGKILFPTVR